jgi:predicted nucleotidyltransferase
MYQKRNNELEVISLYRGNYKARYYLREISTRTKIPLKTCQNTLKSLESHKVLKSIIEGKNKYFSLNLENIKTKWSLLQSEIYQTELFSEKNPQIKLFLKSLQTKSPIIVFGSFAKGTTKKDSDFDLLSITEKEEQLPFHVLPFKPHLINFNEKNFIQATTNESLIKEVMDNHIILSNHSFYVDVMWRHYGQ